VTSEGLVVGSPPAAAYISAFVTPVG
jgi:hypothetical protein